MKILVLSQAYPSLEKPQQMMYVHTRNVEYLRAGHEVKVLSFSSQNEYVFEGVSVVTEAHFDVNSEVYDLVVSHAPNLRNHFRFLYKCKARKIVFIIHGHEALNYNRYYPGEYSQKETLFKNIVRETYERLKLFIFKTFVLTNRKRVSLIFVSQWMKDHYIKNVGKIPECVHTAIIPNASSKVFIDRKWNPFSHKQFDFISIRPLTGKKYAVDVIVKLANKYPSMSFALYGKGEAFEVMSQPPNLTWFNKFILPAEIPDLLDSSKCALMPTRLDSQGVMMCEMATYGIPLITSDLKVCRDVLSSFESVTFIDNDDPVVKLEFIESIKNLNSEKVVSRVYDPIALGAKELAFFSQIVEKSR